MNPTALLPVPDALPVSHWWFEILGVATLSLHLVLVNVLLGGGLLTLWVAWKEPSSDLVKAISDKLPTIFALTVNLGVAPLLFLQVVHGQFFYTSAVLSAVWFLWIIALLILGYYGLYINQYRRKKYGVRFPRSLTASVVLILCISIILTSVFTTMEHPESWSRYFSNAGGTIINLFQTTTVPRYLHFLLASLALGGLFAALMADCGSYRDRENAPRVVELGMKLFTTATLVQMATGLWWLMALRREVLLQFMGDSTPATAALLVAVILTFPALAAGFQGRVKAAAVWTLLTILAMVILRAVVRYFTLEPQFKPSDLPVVSDVSPLVFFVVTLVLGLGVIAYMLRLGFKPNKEV